MKFLQNMALVMVCLSTSATLTASATGNEERGQHLSEREKVIWFDAAGGRRWLAERPAQGAVRGGVLLLAAAQASANGSNHLAALRHTLPDFGWHTYFLNLAQDTSVQDLVAAARAQLRPGLERIVMICEGGSCEDMLALAGEAAAGSVFINVPLQDNSRVDEAVAERWRSFSAPALLLQEHPRQWPQSLALGADVELHLLPVGQSGRFNSRVLRNLRGWLKRRLRAG